MSEAARSAGSRRRWWRAVPLVVVALLADLALYPRLTHTGGRSGDSGRNGLWLRYAWYFGQHSEGDVRGLAESLRTHRIRYAYFHVRDIRSDGKLRYRKRESARRLVEMLHEAAPEVQAVAWVYAGNPRGKGNVDLSAPSVRKAMVAEAAWLVDECGFDGVQWDYEVCPNGDPHFLSLMREARAALLEGKLLSCAAPVWAPWPFTKRWGWSEEYFAEVASTCDQIAVMGYDTGLYLPRAYVWLMRQQVARVPRAVAAGNPKCTAIIGLPTYDTALPAHLAYSENVRLALKGVREGLDGGTHLPTAFAGVALFADYTTDEAEWKAYESLWTRPLAPKEQRP